MKKLSLLIIVLMSILFISSCKKEEKIVYSGSVMLYTDLAEEKVKKLKSDFENEYKGVVLDYYCVTESRIEKKMDENFSLGIPEADVILLNGAYTMESYRDKSWLTPYKSKKDKKIPKENIEENNYYYTVETIEDEVKSSMQIALVKDCINVTNGELLIDYVLLHLTK